MPDKSIKLNWNLFKIVRPECTVPPEPAPDENRQTDVKPEPQEVFLPSGNTKSKFSHRPIRPSELLAYCAGCKEWTPMRWLPVAERGKRAEQWFECEFCGGRNLTLRYLPVKQETCYAIEQVRDGQGGLKLHHQGNA